MWKEIFALKGWLLWKECCHWKLNTLFTYKGSCHLKDLHIFFEKKTLPEKETLMEKEASLSKGEFCDLKKVFLEKNNTSKVTAPLPVGLFLEG